MNSPIKACADLLNRVITDTCPVPWYVKPARCGIAKCGASYCGKGDGDDGHVFAGMLPVVMCPHLPTAALTELPGGPADPRQRYRTAYDDPSFTLHIVGDDLVTLDGIADAVIRKLDRTGHYDTVFGTVNGIRIEPPKRTVRSDRPRYDVQLTINMEMAR